MKINVGSKNKAKLEAVVELLKEYSHLAQAQVEGVEAQSGVADQPKSLDEVVAGAMNRARSAFVVAVCDYGIGLEGGFMRVPKTKTGYMNVCVCAIYDGQEFHLGLSSAWEYPKVFNLVLNEGLDLSAAGNRAGLTNNPGIGEAEGVSGILMRGRHDRKEEVKQALCSALIHLEDFA